MTTLPPDRILQEYLLRLAESAGRGDAREESLYSAFGDLLRQYGAHLGRRIGVTVIPRKQQECLLDFQVWNGGRVAGYVEAKAPGTDLGVAAESEQLARYRRTFPNLLLTDFREIRLFRNGELEARVEISVPGRPELSALLDRFFSFGGVTGPASAAWLATALAGRTRVLSACVLDLLREEREQGRVSRIGGRIGGLLGAFREYLRAQLDDQEFTDLYAQTIAYGLLAARLRRLDRFELRTVIENIPSGSGILRDVFEVLSLGVLPPTLRWIIEDLVDLLAAAPIHAIVRRDFDPLRKKDVIQHFYETFLLAFDKGLRKKRGVYYTPQPVVSFMVRSVHALLRSRFGRADGLADPGVVLLDPAAGTLTFLTEAFRVALEAYAAAHGPGGRAALVRDHLLPHFHAFEVMMAPYAIGHWRARLFFEEHGLPLADDQRVRLYLTNALETEDVRQTVFPFTAALARESLEALQIKKDTAVSVVIGNPPWSGHSANLSSPELDHRLRTSYYQVDGEPLGERNPKWLQDDYVKFIRFAQTKIEQNGEGILCFVTPHGYLDSPTFRGLRRSLMETFDEMYFLDLHGNQRKRERGPDGEPDDNVFDGVAQGVAVAILIRKAGLPKRVFHAEVLGSRTRKERWLGRDVERDCWKEARMTAPSYLIRVDGPGGKEGSEEKYARGIPLPEIFPVRAVGVLTARDEVTIGFDLDDLEKRVARLQEVLRRGDENPWRLDAARAERVRRALVEGAWRRQVRDILYRPFDRRVILYLDALVDRPRRDGMRALLQPALQNFGLVLPRQARGEPAAFVTDRMIAHKAVSAYDINSVFPLRLAPEELFGGRPNLSESLTASFGKAYGRIPAPEEVFHFVYAVLHCPRYRRENEAFLREGFPRIPFPADAALFARLGVLGAELVDLHLLRPASLGELRVRCGGDGRLPLSRRPVWERETGCVLLNGRELWFEGIEPEVWAHRIGGYQVLSSWLTARAGRILSLAEIEHFRRTAAAVERTLEAQSRLDEVWKEIDGSRCVDRP